MSFFLCLFPILDIISSNFKDRTKGQIKVLGDRELESLLLELNEENLTGISDKFVEDKDYLAEK